MDKMAPAKTAKKRKRVEASFNGGGPSDSRPPKQLKRDENLQRPDAVKHALLVQYYPKILTLRQYIFSKLPASSKIRRKKIAAVGNNDRDEDTRRPPGHHLAGVELVLGKLLDTTLVGLHLNEDEEDKAPSDSRWEQWVTYSQKGNESSVALSDGIAGAIYSQSELVDFAIWFLFSREKNPGSRPKHLLCDGFRKGAVSKRQGGSTSGACSISGLFNSHFNGRVAGIKDTPWPQLLTLLGKSGESIMINLLLDCSIFIRVEAGQGNYYQLSGMHIFDSEPLSARTTLNQPESMGNSSVVAERKPAEITFVRSRMLYARAALNARGLVSFGLRHIHALNRFPVRLPSDIPEEPQRGTIGKITDNSVRTMMYMFPRQFGLHNAFTSSVDPFQTAQKFQDYTLREEEIFKKYRQAEDGYLVVHVPKRLRGKVQELVQRLQILHGRCSYAELMKHYCPIAQHSPNSVAPWAGKAAGKFTRGWQKSRQTPASQEAPKHSSLTDLATPASKVSAFCQAVLKKMIPHEFWGKGSLQAHNLKAFLKNVDRFVKLRRFETTSLHELMQGLKITEIEWLEPPGLKNQKTSQTDVRKRAEIFHEFLYYLFDSILIPLIRCNFYVTESSVHRYRLFFFRHDIWRSIAEPAMAALKGKMLEEVKLVDAKKILEHRRLGFSQIRLLPKQVSVRPIMNLRRRRLTTGNKKILGPSINNILGPVYNMLNLEKTLDPGRLGSAMFSVGDLYERLKAFKKRLGPKHGTFYIAKVDVQAAFDTIPQAAILKLMNSVPSQARYEMIKHCEIHPNEHGALTSAKVSKRWYTTAKAARDKSSFPQMIENQTAPNKKNTVFVDSVMHTSQDTRALLQMMASHIQQNLVKIGKKYYRQKDGIPQGSVLSSTLCNYFYADLEKKRLQFLQSEDCLVLRLIDDFLLISTDKSKVTRFVRFMQEGMPKYGVTVSPAKTLVNFDMAVESVPVPKTGRRTFPYCGNQIDCRTLEITKDRDNVKDPIISNALTVEFGRMPGQNFKRKVINAFKIQSHLMYFDSAHNSAHVILKNIYEAFLETAAKTWAYAKCLSTSTRRKDKQPLGSRLLTSTISDLIDVAFLLLTSKARTLKHPGYQCKVKKTQVAWLAIHAFRKVLGRKQAGYAPVLDWLDVEIGKLNMKKEDRRDLACKITEAAM